MASQHHSGGQNCKCIIVFLAEPLHPPLDPDADVDGLLFHFDPTLIGVTIVEIRAHPDVEGEGIAVVVFKARSNGCGPPAWG